MSEYKTIREIRESTGLTRKKCAEQVGVNPSAWGQVEKAEASGSVQLDTLRKYSEVFGCELVYKFVKRDK